MKSLTQLVISDVTYVSTLAVEWIEINSLAHCYIFFPVSTLAVEWIEIGLI